MELQQLIGFIAVSKHQSFSKAARATFRTQPAVSLQVNALEEELGLTLFERLRGKTILTEEGKVFYRLVAPVVEQYEGLKDSFFEQIGQRPGKLTVATHNSVMRYLLPSVIKQFRKEFPQTELVLLNRGKADIIDLVVSREIDFGITSPSHYPAQIIYKSLKKFNRVLITPQNHPLSKKKSISLSDIAPYPLILPPKRSHTRAAVENAFESKGQAPHVALELAGRDSVKEYVKMGLGLSILNEYYLPVAERKSLTVTDVSNLFGKAERGIVMLKDKTQSKWQERFLELLTEQ